jgi:hypothetical protein
LYEAFGGDLRRTMKRAYERFLGLPAAVVLVVLWLVGLLVLAVYLAATLLALGASGLAVLASLRHGSPLPPTSRPAPPARAEAPPPAPGPPSLLISEIGARRPKPFLTRGSLSLCTKVTCWTRNLPRTSQGRCRFSTGDKNVQLLWRLWSRIGYLTPRTARGVSRQ